MTPRNPERFRARFPQVIYQTESARVVATLNSEHRIGFAVEGMAFLDAMGAPVWDRRELTRERVTAVLCEALEAFVAAAADRACAEPMSVRELEALVR